MHIIIGKTEASFSKKEGSPTAALDARRKERRRTRNDRRKAVREGVIVTLSIKNDRRNGRDRRHGG